MAQNNLHNRLLNVIKNHLEGWYVGTIDYISDKIHNGEMYTITYLWKDVANEGSVNLRLLANSTHSCHFKFSITSTGMIYFKTYLDTTYTANGTEYTPFNRKTDVTDSANVTVYTDATIDSFGDLRGDGVAGSGTNAPSRIGATGAGDKSESVLMPDNDMLIYIQNVAGATNDIGININFYEVEE